MPATDVPSTPTGIVVYDAAFSPAVAQRQLSNLSALGSYRRCQGPRTATEHFIESLLCELGEACDEVEYWGREHWQPVRAHCDIDERAARECGLLRFPSVVLVACIEVEAGLRAPTVLWAEVGGLTSAENDADADSSGDGAELQPVLCAVPAVAGRLLRFGGETLHSVPQPLTQHLVAAVDEDEGDDHGGSSSGGDGAGAATPRVRRVLVINCWDRAPDDNAPASMAATAAAAAIARDPAAPPPPTPPSGSGEGRRVAIGAAPRGHWRQVPVERCRGDGTTTAPPPGDDEGTRLSVELFGDARPLMTTVGARRGAVVAMLEAADAPAWLPIRSAGCTGPSRKRQREECEEDVKSS